MERFETMRVVVMHLGGSNLLDTNQRAPFPDLQKTLTLGKYQNLWFELASIVHMSGDEEYPFPRVQEIVRIAFETVGPKKLIWGSDFPTALDICTYRQTLNLIVRQCEFISEEDMVSILGRNARDAYQLKEK
jgi:predicted TIM-barrel fold metal-dependent hydrolase